MTQRPAIRSTIPADSWTNYHLPLVCVYLPLLALALAAVWSRLPASQPAAIAASATCVEWIDGLDRIYRGVASGGTTVVLVAISLIELIALGAAGTTLAHFARDRTTSTRHDLAYFALSLLGWGRHLTVIFTAGAIYVVYLGWGAVRPPPLGLSTGLLAIDALLFYLAHTFFDYWWHRCQHSPRLWPIHRAHHAATHLTPLAAFRSHPAADLLNPIVHAVPIALPFLLVPIPIEVAIVVLTFQGVHNKLEHTMLPWTLGWVGRWLLVSPIGHRIHHSPLPEHADRNFSTCPLWDRLFGTWYDGPVLNEQVGLIEPRPPRANLIAEWVADLRDLVGESR